MLPSGESGSLQFLGDTGNVAAKLEGETSRLNCVLIASAQASETAAPWRRDGLTVRELSIPGKDPMSVCVFRTRAELDEIVRAPVI